MSFSDSKTQVTVISPAWTKSSSTDEAECQTNRIVVDERSVQTRRVRDVEVSTEGEINDETGEKANNDEAAPVSEKALLKFLTRVEPLITKALNANANTRAFFVLQEDFQVAAENKLVTCEYHLHHPTQDSLSAVAVSWNSTGSVIAAALSHTQHDQWCSHRGQIVTWNIRRTKVQKDKADSTFETESCIVCLAYHPVEPSWLAVGCFSGQLLVYDTANADDPVFLKSLTNKTGAGNASLAVGKSLLLSHVDAITHVRWTSGTDLLTASVDGRIVMWKVRKPKRLLEAMRGFLLTVENLPRSLRPKMIGDEALAMRRRQIAITDISVSSSDSELCVLASDCGCVFRCDLQASTDLPPIDVGEAQLHALQSIVFKSCQSPLTHVHCSPFHRSLIAASAANGMLLFYDTVNTGWLRSVDTGEGVLNAVEFSPSRPCVIAAVGNRGHLLLYDLHSNPHSPVCRVEVAENASSTATATQPQAASAESAKIAALCASFNSKDPSLIATGDAKGTLCVWKLANELVVAKPNEVLSIASSILNSAE